jgi:hypothetical protein
LAIKQATHTHSASIQTASTVQTKYTTAYRTRGQDRCATDDADDDDDDESADDDKSDRDTADEIEGMRTKTKAKDGDGDAQEDGECRTGSCWNSQRAIWLRQPKDVEEEFSKVLLCVSKVRASKRRGEKRSVRFILELFVIAWYQLHSACIQNADAESLSRRFCQEPVQ